MYQNVICGILKEKFGAKSKYLNEQYFDAPLTGAPFNLDAIDMVYLFFELESTLKYTINQILNSIQSK